MLQFLDSFMSQLAELFSDLMNLICDANRHVKTLPIALKFPKVEFLLFPWKSFSFCITFFSMGKPDYIKAFETTLPHSYGATRRTCYGLLDGLVMTSYELMTVTRDCSQLGRKIRSQRFMNLKRFLDLQRFMNLQRYTNLFIITNHKGFIELFINLLLGVTTYVIKPAYTCFQDFLACITQPDNLFCYGIYGF